VPVRSKPSRWSRTLARKWPLVAVVAVAGMACRSGPEALMETPVLYLDEAIDPFAHLPHDERTRHYRVLYATDRARRASYRGVDSYGTAVGRVLRVGEVQVGLGDPGMTWEELHDLSTSGERDEHAYLVVEDVDEMATLERARHDGLPGPLEDPGLRRFAAAIEERLARARDRDLLVYVHGAKTELERCVSRTAEFAHFAGRDLVSIAFDWPSHPNIFSYVWGDDHRRAADSADSLRSLLSFLATHTSARKIHVIAYSAGGITVSKALDDLRREFARMTRDELIVRFRIGVVLFAAADVPAKRFVHRMPAMHDLAERVAITVSDADGVLGIASSILHGGQRLGKRCGGLTDVERHLAERFPRTEWIDVSHGKETRGFDIGGHTYWYRHPWVSSDCILNIRTDRPAGERGLVPTDSRGVYHLPHDYPDRAREAVRRILGGRWDALPEGAWAPPPSGR